MGGSRLADQANQLVEPFDRHHDHAAVAGGPVIPIRSHPADGRPGSDRRGCRGGRDRYCGRAVGRYPRRTVFEPLQRIRDLDLGGSNVGPVLISGHRSSGQGGETVDRTQEGVDELRRDDPTRPELLETLFHGMGDPADAVEANDRGGSFERVHLTEDGADEGSVVAVSFEFEHQPTEALEPDLRLLGEQGLELLQVEGAHWSCSPPGTLGLRAVSSPGAKRASTSMSAASRSPTA